MSPTVLVRFRPHSRSRSRSLAGSFQHGEGKAPQESADFSHPQPLAVPWFASALADFRVLALDSVGVSADTRGMTPTSPTSSVLSIASVVSARFPSLTIDQCVFAARRALANGSDDAEGYALSLAYESSEAMAVRRLIQDEYNLDCDASYGEREPAPKRHAGGIYLHSDFHPHHTMEPADARCNVCGRESSPGERWYVCDTCEDCRFARGAKS